MFRFIYRQRRRILFTGFFISLAVGTFIATIGPQFGTIWIDVLVPVLTALVVGLGVALILTFALPILPDWRHLGELVAVMVLVELCLSVPFPDYFGLYAISSLSWLCWFAVFVVLYSLTYGTWLDRFPMWVGHKSRRSVVLPQAAEDHWPLLLPGKGTVEQHWDALLEECTPDPEDPDSYELRYTHGGGIYHHVSITYLEDEPFSHARYYFTSEVDPRNRSVVDGIYDVRLENAEKGRCRVTITETRNALLPRVGLNCWFDDYLGDYVDHLRATLDGRRDWSLQGRFRRKALSLS